MSRGDAPNRRVFELADVEPDMAALVGGKAIGLAGMIKAGEQVPAGFCVSTDAHREGVVPVEDLIAAYERLGRGSVAVRSSSTAEDLPHASFAGQQETVLWVTGADALQCAVRRCWASLDSERAIAYRRATGVDHAAMAVVVQRMVDASVAGVMFTANPLSGCRAEMVVDAAPGLGTAVVNGAVIPDHYVLGVAGVSGPADGCLSARHLTELRETGHRLERFFGGPQDVEWAIDEFGQLWFLQSRPITTLFPAPPCGGRRLRAYIEIGAQLQGVGTPFTPMGVAVLKTIAPQIAGFFGLGSQAFDDIVDVGGRLYLDLSEAIGTVGARRWLPAVVAANLGSRASAAVEHLIGDPRFAPQRLQMIPRGQSATSLVTATARAAWGIGRSLLRPAASRMRAFDALADFRDSTGPGTAHPAAARLSYVEEVSLPAKALPRIVWPLLAGLAASAASMRVLTGLATEAEVLTMLSGMPHNVTMEMDLQLWKIAREAADHRELLLNTPVPELVAMYRAGRLPDIGIARFLDGYGHRAAVEIDVGVPRWSEDPAPLFAAIANYLRSTDSEEAPDHRFARAVDRAEGMAQELTRRARGKRPARGILLRVLLGRARALAGLRELGKFAGLYLLQEIRRQLRLIGTELTAAGLLDDEDDVMFLDLAEVRAAIENGVDHRARISGRRAVHEREGARRHVPVVLLGDGTDVEAICGRGPAVAGQLTGMAASPGSTTGPARVIRDPIGAYIEPGEILVAPTTDPGWTPLFLTAGGLVTEIGAPLAHGPTVAREYGIPAVIGVRDATQAIKTGQVITVDGTVGTVWTTA